MKLISVNLIIKHPLKYFCLKCYNLCTIINQINLQKKQIPRKKLTNPHSRTDEIPSLWVRLSTLIGLRRRPNNNWRLHVLVGYNLRCLPSSNTPPHDHISFIQIALTVLGIIWILHVCLSLHSFLWFKCFFNKINCILISFLGREVSSWWFSCSGRFIDYIW